MFIFHFSPTGHNNALTCAGALRGRRRPARARPGTPRTAAPSAPPGSQSSTAESPRGTGGPCRARSRRPPRRARSTRERTCRAATARTLRQRCALRSALFRFGGAAPRSSGTLGGRLTLARGAAGGLRRGGHGPRRRRLARRRRGPRTRPRRSRPPARGSSRRGRASRGRRSYART